MLWTSTPTQQWECHVSKVHMRNFPGIGHIPWTNFCAFTASHSHGVMWWPCATSRRNMVKRDVIVREPWYCDANWMNMKARLFFYACPPPPCPKQEVRKPRTTNLFPKIILNSFNLFQSFIFNLYFKLILLHLIIFHYFLFLNIIIH